MKGNFAGAWEEIGPAGELEDTYSLPFKSLEEAVKNLVVHLGLQVLQMLHLLHCHLHGSYLQACERSDKVPEGKSSHTLLLSGVFRGGSQVGNRPCCCRSFTHLFTRLFSH